MKKIRITAIILTLALMISAVSADGAAFDQLDAKTADAGASYYLGTYCEVYEDAQLKLADALRPIISIAENQHVIAGYDQSENGDEVLYDEWQIGIVGAEATLNVRASATVLSDIVAKVFRGLEIYVTGEKLVNGHKWYKVSVEGVEGYAMSSYILFGDAASDFLDELHTSRVENAKLPESFEIKDDISYLDASSKEELTSYANMISYVLKNDYPEQEAAGSYVGMYSILVYMLENYQHIADIASEYSLTETYRQANQDMYYIELSREKLAMESGQSVDELAESARKAAEEAAAEEAYRISQSMSYKLANLAAQYIGVTPYVWGGASLQYGADCSGFCAQIYAAYGLLDQASANVHAYDSRSLRNVGYAVSVENILPGDLVCYNGHVAIYYGNGTVVHAPSPGHYVCYGNLYMMPIVAIRRLY